MSTVTNPTVRRDFTKIPNVVISNPLIGPHEKLVVIYVLSFDECFASQKKMSHELGISRSSVQRAISNLFKMRVLRKTIKTGWSCFYSVNPATKWDLAVLTEKPTRAPNEAGPAS